MHPSDNVDALTCDVWGDAPSELRLVDLLNEEAGREGDNEEDAEEVTFIN